MAAKVGRPTGSKNKQKEKTLENFGMSRDPEKEMERRIEGIMRICKEETVSEMREHCEKLMEKLMGNILKEMQEEREAREEERRKWKEERKEMLERIQNLEMVQEKKEREEKKKNIVIRGINIEKTNIEKRIEEFVKEKLGVEIKVEKAYEIKEREGKKGIVVTVEEWEMKRNIMVRRKNLDRGIYIDDDLTRREREIQGRLRRRAREEKEKGKEVKIGYKKISVNGKWFKWNEKEDCLNEEKEEEKERRGRQ
ncbi:uncharacterized protein [Polyergus mexicanus]|uniref:uncharacterized protein n=1 Tax=Polyergus mexicanus TaxID=615972 RepID=UPI0038B41F1C